MISAVRYVGGVQDPQPVDAADVGAAIDPAKGLVWIDTDDPAAAEEAAAHLRIDPLASEDIRRGGQRTKIENYRDHIHVAVHDCAFHADRLEQSEIDLVLGDGWLLSVRHETNGGPALPIDDVRQRFESQRVEPGSDDEGVLLWAILDVVVDRYVDIAELIDQRIASLQDMVFAEQRQQDMLKAIPKAIFTLDKALLHFRQAAMPLGEIVTADYVAFVDDLGRRRLRDVADHARRVTDQISTQQQLVDGLLSADLALRSQSTNDVMKRMTSWGAILLGSTLIAGIYGMNFRNMPELRWYLGYPFALGTMAVLTVTLYFWFRKKQWL
jgi:magnesium transporter